MKNESFISISQLQYEKCFRLNHTIKNPKFFDIDKIYNDFITNHNRKFDSYFVECGFKLVIINHFNPHIKAEFYHNTSFMNFKKNLVYLLYTRNEHLKPRKWQLRNFCTDNTNFIVL